MVAVDYGLRRIGLAVSDPTGTLASPAGVIRRRRGKRPPFAKILAAAARHEAAGFVVGLPLHGDVCENDWTAEVRAFARKLKERSGLPVFLVDESYSSVEAEHRIRSIGLPRKARESKSRIDAGAAAVFLQDWLDGGSAGNG